jgi:membrane protease YdiL (CAAX protease family)
VVWPAIAVSALLFGALHVPALAGVAPLTLPFVARTIALNAALGLLFGFAYWRYALECAMFSHALVHVVFGVAGAVTAGAAPTLLGP